MWVEEGDTGDDEGAQSIKRQVWAAQTQGWMATLQ